jgi:hypothetical protein
VLASFRSSGIESPCAGASSPACAVLAKKKVREVCVSARTQTRAAILLGHNGEGAWIRHEGLLNVSVAMGITHRESCRIHLRRARREEVCNLSSMISTAGDVARERTKHAAAWRANTGLRIRIREWNMIRRR